jgi:para-nitrobenzyl esterase
MDNTIATRASLVMLCSCLAAACGTDDKPDPTLVKVASGEVRGSIVGTSRQFLGIPYAKPPVGALRWKAPVAPDPWATPRDATQFGKRCAQVTTATLQNKASSDEDCLYLNVWTPSPAPRNAAVMVWMHGGGNVNGSASEPIPFLNTGLFYSGEFLAESHGVIVVSINYRLGVFGFFAHSDLVGEEGHAGNQGLQDQQLALQWVHDNIAQFGGDAGNVTLFGESAGSFDTCMHVASPASGGAGLFQRAISESGGCTTKQPTMGEAAALAAKFATDLGCAGAGSLTCLRGKAAADIMMSADVASPDPAVAIPFGPNVDGWFMPDQPRAIFDAGNAAKIPYLLGSNTDEGTLFLPATKPTNQDEYMAALTKMFGAGATNVAAKYPLAQFMDAMPNAATAALARVIGDSRLVCTTFDAAMRQAHAGAPVFLYNFDIPLPAAVTGGVSLGATHGSELAFVFGTSPLLATDTVGKAASDLIQRYWTNFAKTGNPNAAPDPNWPAATEAQNVRINIAAQATVVTDFRAAECAFWRAGYAMQFP